MEIRTRAQVVEVAENTTGVKVYVAEKIRGRFAFQAAQAVLCTNAFTNTLLPELEILPARGQILITKPIPGISWQGTFHFDQGYYYFRNVGNRILFGGGRNLDFDGETSTALEYNYPILQHLKGILHEVIFPGSQPI